MRPAQGHAPLTSHKIEKGQKLGLWKLLCAARTTSYGPHGSQEENHGSGKSLCTTRTASCGPQGSIRKIIAREGALYGPHRVVRPAQCTNQTSLSDCPSCATRTSSSSPHELIQPAPPFSGNSICPPRRGSVRPAYPSN